MGFLVAIRRLYIEDPSILNDLPVSGTVNELKDLALVQHIKLFLASKSPEFLLDLG